MNEHLRPAEACQYLGIAISTLWAWVKDGRLPQPMRLSRKCSLFKRKELDEAIIRLSEMTQKI